MFKKIDPIIILPHLVAIIIFVVSSLVYFYPQLQGKTINPSDISQFQAMAKEAVDYQKETGETVLWTGSMFSGMPTFQLTSPQKSNLVKYVENIFQLGFSRPIGYFIMGMICYYLFLVFMGINPWISILGAMFFAFASGNVILYEAGHTSKMRAIFLSPPLIAGVYYIFRKKYLIGSTLFTLFLALNITSNHPQMTYYLAMVMSIFVIIHVINMVKDKKGVDLGKQLGVLIICSLLALAPAASKLLPTYEYAKSTMRGEPILKTDPSTVSSSSNTDGLEWNYAMNWSNGWSDILATYIPLIVGGSTAEKIDKNTPLSRYANQPWPLYWGGLPSTSGPYYFGALVIFLFIFGGIVVKGELKWWIIIGVLFTFLISLGKNLEWFNRPIFDILPLYNKFRTPNSVLNVTSLLIPLLSVLGLNELIKAKDKSQFIRPLMYSFAGLGGIALLLFLIGGSLFQFNGNYDNQLGELVNATIDTRKEYLTSSSLKTLFIMALGVGLIYLYIKNKVNSTILIMSIGVIAILDLWIIDKRYVNSDDFEAKSDTKKVYNPRPVDQQILQDPDIHYRVYDVSTDPFRNAMPAYHHKLIGGYHPAKLQRYEDIIDRYLRAGNNMAVLNMLNTKYFIVNGQDNQLAAQRNPDALGNAWFVNNIKYVSSPNEEISEIGNISPEETAIVHEEFKKDISSNAYSGQGEITLSSYTPNKLVYNTNSNSDQFAVFSEVWYSPGWQAFIDGESVPHVRVNYILRGLEIPQGAHEIIFEFKPASYATGEWISLISSILIFGLIGLVIYSKFKPNLTSFVN